MKRILLVEDEEGLVLTLTDRLTSEGYQVESATHGDAGLARGLAGAFDLILLDIMLPGRSGFDVCRRLRQSGIATPILMLTARGGVVDKVEGLQIGADDYMGSPSKWPSSSPVSKPFCGAPWPGPNPLLKPFTLAL